MDLDHRNGHFRDLLMVSGVALLLALPYLAGVSFSDEGYIVHIADRITSGEVLYRDISTGVTPGSFYLHALLFQVFGRSLLVGRIFMMVLFSAAVGTVYGMCRGVSSRTMALALSLSFAALTVFFWRIPNYSSEAIIWILLAVGSTARYLKTGKREWIWAAGFSLGAAFLFKQNYGVFAALGVTAGLLSDGESWRKRVLSVLTTASVAATTVILVILYFAGNGALGALWNDVVMIPLRYNSTIYSLPYPTLFGELPPEVARNLWSYLPFQTLFLALGDPNRSFLGLKVLTIRALFYLPPACLVVALATWFRRRWGAAGDQAHLSVGMLYLASSAFLLLGAFPRSDAFHLVKVIILFFPLVAWIMGASPGRWQRRIAVVTTAVLMILSVGSQVVHVWGYRPFLRQTTFLSLPAARIWAQESTAERITNRVQEIQNRVPPGEPIFAGPALPLYYFLADRPNPTRYPLILPGGLDEEAVVNALDSSGVQLALVEDYGLENFSFSEVTPVVWDHVMRNFGPVEETGWTVSPYLLLKGGNGQPRTGILLRGDTERADAVEMTTGSFDPRERITVSNLVRRPQEKAPPRRIQGLFARMESSWRTASWRVVFLRPALQMISPANWNKMMVSWEVPVGPNLLFEVACGLAPDPWAGMDNPIEGQGGVAEIWIGPAKDGQPPRRVWVDWLDPGHGPQERGWRLVALDLASFVDARLARVTLVARPAPTFSTSGARIAWSGIRLSRPENSGGVDDGPSKTISHFDEGNVREIILDDWAAENMMTLTSEDLDLSRRAVERYPNNLGALEMLGTIAASLGEDEEALQVFLKLARLSDPEEDALLRPGSRMILERRLRKILESLRAAAQLNRGHTDADLVATVLSVKLGRLCLRDALRRIANPRPKISPEERAKTGLHFDDFENVDLSGWTNAIGSVLENGGVTP